MFSLPKLPMSEEMQESSQRARCTDVGFRSHESRAGGNLVPPQDWWWSRKVRTRRNLGDRGTEVNTLAAWAMRVAEVDEPRVTGNLLGEHGLHCAAQLGLRTSARDISCCRDLSISLLRK